MTPAKGQPSPREGKPYPPELLTEDDVRLLMKQCSRHYPTGIRNRALIMFIYRSGLRISEALALRCADVNMDTGVIHVLRGKGSKPRTLGIDDEALAVLQRWLDKRKELGIRANGNPLFCTLKGGPVSDRYVRDMLHRIGAKAGIEKTVRPHGLRHSYAAELIAEGEPINKVSKALGHANSGVTARYIDHIQPHDVIAMGRKRKPFTEDGKDKEEGGEEASG